MIPYTLVILAWIVSTAVGAVTGLTGEEKQLIFQLMQNDKPHYSTFEEHPINLQQYSSDKVIRVNYGEDEDLLKALVGGDPEVEFKKWSKNSAERSIDIQINSDNLEKLKGKFTNLTYKVVIEDLAQSIFETYPDSAQTMNFEGDFHATSDLFFKEYRPLELINSWLELLTDTYPDVITLETIGKTYEGRPLNVVHLSIPDDDIEHHDRKTIVLTTGTHAREWISVSTLLYTIYKMLEYYENNPDNRRILTKLDFLFIPVMNPDGYVYTWEHDRLWRKNRQAVSEDPNPKNCLGIDIDHSYNFHWTHSSDDACGEEYSGEYAFEAYESKIWDDYLNATNKDHKIWGYLDLHSYSEEILMPYAYSCEQNPRDEENLIELAYGISKAIRTNSGKYYSVLPACLDRDSDLLPDLGSGTALDYMYHNKAYWAYQLKLRDSGNHGFLLPHKYIEPVGEETFAGIQYFCKFILNDD